MVGAARECGPSRDEGPSVALLLLLLGPMGADMSTSGLAAAGLEMVVAVALSPRLVVGL